MRKYSNEVLIGSFCFNIIYKQLSIDIFFQKASINKNNPAIIYLKVYFCNIYKIYVIIVLLYI